MLLRIVYAVAYYYCFRVSLFVTFSHGLLFLHEHYKRIILIFRTDAVALFVHLRQNWLHMAALW